LCQSPVFAISRNFYCKALLIRNLQKIDKLHNKLDIM
jgi:hypothetical protein